MQWRVLMRKHCIFDQIIKSNELGNSQMWAANLISGGVSRITLNDLVKIVKVFLFFKYLSLVKCWWNFKKTRWKHFSAEKQRGCIIDEVYIFSF